MREVTFLLKKHKLGNAGDTQPVTLDKRKLVELLTEAVKLGANKDVMKIAYKEK